MMKGACIDLAPGKSEGERRGGGTHGGTRRLQARVKPSVTLDGRNKGTVLLLLHQLGDALHCYTHTSSRLCANKHSWTRDKCTTVDMIRYRRYMSISWKLTCR